MIATTAAIIPTFNRATLLPRAIRSVFKQTHRPQELWVVDDASHDGSREIILSLFSEAPEGLQCFYHRFEENRGVSCARNFAAEATQCDWLAFLDSDDEWLPKRLQLQHQLLEKNWHPLVHGNECWYRKGEFVNQKKIHQKGGGDQFIRALELCIISPSASLVDRKTFWQCGGFDTQFVVCEDYDLWLKLTLQFNVGFVEETIINKFGGHSDQLSGAFKAMDRWRVESMLNLRTHYIPTHKLESYFTPEKESALYREVSRKSEILSLGFAKHGDQEQSEYFKNLSMQFADKLSAMKEPTYCLPG